MKTLSHKPREVRSLYENSFKQLSDVQQRQVGLIVGAAVGDAAAFALEGRTPLELECIEDDKELPFARISSSSSSSKSISTAAPPPHSIITEHSFSYALMYDMLQTMAAERGDFPVDAIAAKWAARAGSNPLLFSEQHATLLHTLVAVLPAPAIYPWAGDDALRTYLEPFLHFLTEPPLVHSTAAAALAEQGVGMDVATAINNNNNNNNNNNTLEEDEKENRALVEAAALEARQAVKDCTVSTLGVVLRYLQSNPDAVRNASFMSVPGIAAEVFPVDVQKFCPPPPPPPPLKGQGKGKGLDSAMQAFWAKDPAWTTSRGSGIPGLQRSLLHHDIAVVQQSMLLAQSSKSFEVGIQKSIRMGGPVCQRSMLVGAMLGAKLGIRRLPMEWISAMRDNSPVCTFALEVAQWAWNPPHH